MCRERKAEFFKDKNATCVHAQSKKESIECFFELKARGVLSPLPDEELKALGQCTQKKLEFDKVTKQKFIEVLLNYDAI